jgi:hypothetical protein
MRPPHLHCAAIFVNLKGQGHTPRGGRNFPLQKITLAHGE